MSSFQHTPTAFNDFMETVMQPVSVAGAQEERIAAAACLTDLDDADLLFVLAGLVAGQRGAAAAVAVLRDRARCRLALPVASAVSQK